jgi:RNA polymerase sigma-70 factor (ECF subfamily)
VSDDRERAISALRASGDLRGTAEQVIEAYGPEVLGWLIATTRDRRDAEEAFGAAAEDLWRSLPTFRGECSMRTWLYLLARHALQRQRRGARAALPLSEASEIAARVRSGTAPWLRTDVKDRFAKLRDELPEEDRSLLVLRVDRGLAWEDVAMIVASEEEPKRASARLRKRFQSIKEHLRKRAREEGLLGDEP